MGIGKSIRVRGLWMEEIERREGERREKKWLSHQKKERKMRERTRVHGEKVRDEFALAGGAEIVVGGACLLKGTGYPGDREG